MASLLINKSSFAGAAKVSTSKRSVTRSPLVVRAQKDSVEVGRRATLGSMAGAIALLSGVAPSLAEFGESANVFGRVTNKSGFIPYAGDGFAVLVPSKWNPSNKAYYREFEGIQLRYEDNFDTINCFSIIANPTDKKSISDFGSPEELLKSIGFLLGQQAYSGETQSEGGFKPNRVSAASLLNVGQIKDKKGLEYYTLDILTRTGDGNEGGKHNLIKATVADGKLWLLKIQIGDKRWIRGQKEEARGIFESFTVA